MTFTNNIQANRNRSMLTKTGKKRLGPLNLKQLEEFLQESTKPKDKAKIRNRISILEKRLAA